jgi:hypothetical protein
LQETKLQNVTPTIVRNALGGEFESNYIFQPANGTRGGLLLAARDSFFSLQQLGISANTITAQV